jgi:uncharacterized membrane protein YkvA (DUF1232 family)
MNTSRDRFLGISYGWWVVICVIYTLSPIDLVPALLLGPIGLGDNLGVIAFGFYNFIRWLESRSATRLQGSNHATPARVQRVVDVEATPVAPRRALAAEVSAPVVAAEPEVGRATGSHRNGHVPIGMTPAINDVATSSRPLPPSPPPGVAA